MLQLNEAQACLTQMQCMAAIQRMAGRRPMPSAIPLFPQVHLYQVYFSDRICNQCQVRFSRTAIEAVFAIQCSGLLEAGAYMRDRH